MEAIDYLAQCIQAIVMDDIEAGKEAHAKYAELKMEELVNEDHDKLLTDEGIDDFLKTLHKRAKKAGKEDAFFKELSKFTSKKVECSQDFDKTVDHFSKNKKSADKFIHHIESILHLTKDDPAKDIKGEGKD